MRFKRVNQLQLHKESHWLELQEIQSNSNAEVNCLFVFVLRVFEANVTFKTGKVTIGSEAVDDIINNIRESYSSAFPGYNLQIVYNCYSH